MRAATTRRRRRSPTWNPGIDPRSIPGLQAWLRASWVWHVHEGSVDAWPSEGPARRFVQAAGGNQPRRRYNQGPFGIDTINFESGGAHRFVADGQVIPTGGDVTFIFVAALTRPGSGQMVMDTGADSAVSRHFVQLTSTGVMLGRDGSGGQFVNNSFTANEWAVFHGTTNGASSSITINGSNEVTGTISTSTTAPATNVVLGARFSQDAAFLNTQIAELLIYSPRIDRGARRALEQMLGRRYGIAADPPVFAPTDISGLTFWVKADGTLWQDSARTTPATADNDPVGAWDDASGSGAHFTQATAGNRPTLKTSIVNGKPVLRFDGSSDRMAGSASAATKPLTAFAVLYTTGTIIGSSVAGGLHWRGNQEILKEDIVSIGSDGGAAMTGFTILAVTYSGSGVYTFYRNGSQTATGTNNQTFSASTTVIGYNGANNIELANGDMAEIIKYDSVLSTADLNRVGNYLEAKYGVSWTDL